MTNNSTTPAPTALTAMETRVIRWLAGVDLSGPESERKAFHAAKAELAAKGWIVEMPYWPGHQNTVAARAFV